MPLTEKNIKSALVSVYYKDGLDEILKLLVAGGVKLYSTGGTAEFIRGLGMPVVEISDLTGFPSILGGRVKTLHPKVFGGILARRDDAMHVKEVTEHEIPYFDLVIVNLYPFEETVRNSVNPLEIIEKIDVGGPSMLRAGAKNHQDVMVIPNEQCYAEFHEHLKTHGPKTNLATRKRFAAYTFEATANYDRAIANWFAVYGEGSTSHSLRYGENPHQPATFHGNLDEIVEKLGGKELSYNNLLDVEGALRLISDFQHEPPTFAIIKHTNPCGVATRDTVKAAWESALASDPVSAFGGILVTNVHLDLATAELINEHFYEVLLAPSFEPAAVELLLQKKNRILLRYKHLNLPNLQVRSILNGRLEQQVDNVEITGESYQVATSRKPTDAEMKDLLFGEKLARHLKSNAIALVKNQQLIGGGMGQTSRIDSMRHALEKAHFHGFDASGAVLASDGFFPFSDSVATAHKAGIQVILQPGGSIRDEETIQFCEQNGLCLVITGIRHFRH
jgi:phosphoribosylaminoimidazolecarboxamide formyltransferase / IMP cyclohydrolase